MNIINGDLFAGNSESIAHCVSEDFEMSLGIAKIFKNKFGNVENLLNQEKKVGQTAYIIYENKFIFYLVTKKRYFNKPSYKSLKNCLIDMREIMLINGIKSLDIPKIGCGLDKLVWEQNSKFCVKNIIDEVFQNTEIDINVYVL